MLPGAVADNTGSGPVLSATGDPVKTYTEVRSPDL